MAWDEPRNSSQKQNLQQLNVRVPKDVYDALRTYAYAADSSINEAVLRALADFLASQGRQEEVDSFLRDARKQFRVALDKLADLQVVRYLTASEVVLINQEEAGPDLLVDFGLLEAAVLRPQQSLFGSDAYPDIHTKAAAMMYSLIRNHPFVDGNKRTGVLSVILFYNLNGYSLQAEQGDVVALALDVAEGQIDVESIAGTLKSWVRPLNLPDK